MKIKYIVFALMAIVSLGASAQYYEQRDVKMPTESNLGERQQYYLGYEKGFFCAAEASGAFSVSDGKKNIAFAELDFTGGYRFNDYLRVGAGLGARRYFDPNDARYMTHKWGMPLYLNVRGNFIRNGYRNVVPFWSCDLGTTFPDGFMFRPNFGIRVGQARSAFVLSIGYLGQNIRASKLDKNDKLRVDHPFYSFITLKLGYEF